MKVFITGANGFIGSNLVRELLKEGHRTYCLCRREEAAVSLAEQGADIVYGDLLNITNLGEYLQQCDVVIHVAGITKSINESGYYRGNVQTTERLLQAIRQHAPPHQRLVYISSQAAAGPSIKASFSELDFARPISAYGKSKRAAERAVLELKDDRDVVILRPSIVFGPRDREMLPLFKGAQLGIIVHAGFRYFPVNFIYIDDLVRAIILSATHENAPGKIFFVHDGRSSSWKIMNKILAAELNGRAITVPVLLQVLHFICLISGSISRFRGKPSYMNPDKWLEIKQSGWLCSSSSIETELGFSTDRKLSEAVALTANWYRKNKFIK